MRPLPNISIAPGEPSEATSATIPRRSGLSALIRKARWWLVPALLVAGCEQTPTPLRASNAQLVTVAQVPLDRNRGGGGAALKPGATDAPEPSRIPSGALVQQPGRQPQVWTLDAKNQATRHDVDVRAQSGRGASVRGLTPGVLVVIDPAPDLRDGDTVLVTNGDACSTEPCTLSQDGSNG